jgi:hypothetical protein
MTWMAADTVLVCRRRLLDSSLMMMQRFPGLLWQGTSGDHFLRAVVLI